MLDQVWPIFEEAFAPEFRRSRGAQEALLHHPRYHLEVYRTPDGDVAGFLAWWDFDAFAFGEHLAVDKKRRGQGLGAVIVKDLLSKRKTVILEVEEPDSEINRRRISFYERNGLILHDFPYCQPPFLQGQTPIPLKIMASRNLNREEFIKFRNAIFHEVYRMDAQTQEKFYYTHGM